MRSRAVTVEDRRSAMVRRHHLGGDARTPEQVVAALVALHASDPASVYLSVLARSACTTLEDVASAMYERRRLVRWMAMRRTLFVFAYEDIPMVQAAVSDAVATALRTQLIGRLEHDASDPPVAGDVGQWVANTEARVEQALTERGAATGSLLRADVPALATTIPPRTPSERPQRVTSSLLTLMAAEGKLVRGRPTGSWTTRTHQWEPASNWWPGGLPSVDEAQARSKLARRWLRRFGPARTDDLQWWTGWTKTATRSALARLPIVEVDLHGAPGIHLDEPSDAEAAEAGQHTSGVATLLPALDPTPMGWKHRDWFIGIDPRHIFDRAGNIGPTVWWNGEIIGGWALTARGTLTTKILADRGREASDAIHRAASVLHDRLHDARVVPAARTPLERSLT